MTRATRRQNPAPGAVLRINHYFTRSRQEFAAKINIRGDFGGFKARKKSRMANMIEHETVHDHTILRFAPALRERISRRQFAVIKGGAPLAPEEALTIENIWRRQSRRQ
jgi:hypothetical protein